MEKMFTERNFQLFFSSSVNLPGMHEKGRNSVVGILQEVLNQSPMTSATAICICSTGSAWCADQFQPRYCVPTGVQSASSSWAQHVACK